MLFFAAWIIIELDGCLTSLQKQLNFSYKNSSKTSNADLALNFVHRSLILKKSLVDSAFGDLTY